MYKLIALALVAAVSCNDLIQGPTGGRKIYDANQEASPAIWKQKNEVTIKANDTEVISRIVITDLRPDKDGEAKIVNGGPGQNNVTVELKSPTILRGFSFHVEVYAAEDNGQQIAYPKTYPVESVVPEEVPVSTEQVPVSTEQMPVSTEQMPVSTGQIPVMENDTKVNPDTKKDSDKPVTEGTTTTEYHAKVQGKLEAPIMTDRKSRTAEDTTVVPTAQNVIENNTVMDTDVTSKGTPLKSYSLLSSSYPKLQDNEDQSKVTMVQDASYNANHPRLGMKDEFNKHGLKTNVNKDSYEEKAVPTTETIKTMAESHKTGSTAFRGISEELGQHVVFGIKRM
ncbi:Immune-related Hdd1 [Operophtera brumata]|uniref:Immune-related Hdd1 n=1 Tax=Operophtera brumata TaxID=104452 RepID=A0A0L7LGC9_OPEBR|nr:Immune-related Hdd1 [Operophtera brumata]